MFTKYRDPTELIASANAMSINLSLLDIAHMSSAEFNEIYSNQEFVIADTETTGFDGEIIEIGAVIVKGGQVRMKDGSFMDFTSAQKQIHNVDFFGKLIYPIPQVDKNGNFYYYIPELISNLTHIDIDLMDRSEHEPMPNQSSKDFAASLFEFIDFCGDRPVVGHNMKFDIGRIAAAIAQFHPYDLFDYMRAYEETYGETIDHKLYNFCHGSFIDTLADAKKILIVNSEENHKNATLSARYGLIADENTLHRAYYDTFFTGNVFYGLLQECRRIVEEIESVGKIINREG